MFMRTPRLLLRPGWKEDAPALARAIADPAIVRNLATAPWPYRLEDAEAFLSRPQDPMLPNLLILRRTLGAPQLIGAIGLMRIKDQVELGYWISRPCWGLGFATEAGRAMIEIADHALGLEEVRASVFAGNVGSRVVLEKLGFVQTGQTLRHCAARDATVPALTFERRLGERPASDEGKLAA